MRYLFLLALTFSFIALSFNGVYAAEGNGKGLLDKLKDAVAEIVTGDDVSDEIGGNEGDGGNENALEQIDKNLEKHGGEHKGLENARAAVSKSKHKNKNKKHRGSDGDGDDLDADDLIDDAVGAVEEALIGEDVNESLSEKSKAHKGKGRGHSK